MLSRLVTSAIAGPSGASGTLLQALAGAWAAPCSASARWALSMPAAARSFAAEAAAPQQATSSTGSSGQQAQQASASAQEGAAASGSSAPASSTAPSQTLSFGARKLQAQQSRGPGQLQEGIVHISNTMNNILLALTDSQGKVKAQTSAGVVGFRNARKSLPVAAEKAADELAKRALKMGYGSVVVRLKGVGNNKQVALQALHAAGLRITALEEVTAIPYNGCRLPKRRRV